MRQENLNYYKVVAKCGHVGKCNYIPIAFAVIAESGKEVSKKVREFPRVKHNHKDAILRCDKISYEEYVELKEINNNDLYLKCTSKHEQNSICDLTDRLVEDKHHAKPNYHKEDRQSRVHYKLSKYNQSLKSVTGDDLYEYAY